LRPYLPAVFLLAAALCAPPAAAAPPAPSSDYAREKRWADEIVPGLVVGQAVWLQGKRPQKFLALYAEAKDAKGAVILAHGLGVNPDYGLIGNLRARLYDMGYSTLAIQMPILAADAPPEGYAALFPEANERLATAISYLHRKGYRRITLVSHSMGSRMAGQYIARYPKVPLTGWIALSVSGGEFPPLKRMGFPVYDVYGEKDLEAVTAGAAKRAAMLKRLRGSGQVMVYGADHFYAKKEKELASLIRFLIEGEPK
jgi:pimeloyl-ACP methyl ester carboxylesterase